MYRADLKKAKLGEPSCPYYPCGFNPGLELLTRAVATNPAIDKLGQVVIFDSAGDVLGPGTSNGSSQIYVRDFSLSSIRAITNGIGNSKQAVIARTASKVFFSSEADLAGTGNTRFNIFEADISVDPAEITQLTFGTDGDSTAPSVTGRADKIAFSVHCRSDQYGADGHQSAVLSRVEGQSAYEDDEWRRRHQRVIDRIHVLRLPQQLRPGRERQHASAAVPRQRIQDFERLAP